jgi:hypothetical protein
MRIVKFDQIENDQNRDVDRDPHLVLLCGRNSNTKQQEKQEKQIGRPAKARIQEIVNREQRESDNVGQ